MTFIVSSNGVNNTSGTTAKFGPGGSVKIGGHFQNSGNVEIDIRANLDVLGNLINSGNFRIKDYIVETQYGLIESAIRDLSGEPKNYLEQSLEMLKQGDVVQANSWFKRFGNYIKEHPELVTSTVSALLQLFLRQ